MSELRIVEDWSDPETRGHTIPGARYTSKEFFEQEWEGMWTKVWLLLGREALSKRFIVDVSHSFLSYPKDIKRFKEEIE